MCKLGDIIVIKEFKNELGKKITRHSFVVINDEENSIEGMQYDFIGHIDLELLDELLQLILILSKEGKLKYITTNLNQSSVD